ncbi:MAG: elongation factor P [Myxococcales bacterium]|nr:elongation factor P [Myxococcales bacterium]MCB9546968.1 elongation factor P [Myxococcales bacterium]
MISTSDFKKGQRVEVDGQPWTVERSTTQSPSARGGATLVKVRLRNVLTGQISDRTFKSGEKFPEPDLQLRNAQYLYATPGETGTDHVFMDTASYEQFELTADALGDQAQWLVDNLEVRSVVYNDKVVGIDLPQFVEMELTEVAPGSRGDTASGGATTTATTATGVTIQVPLYIKTGDVVRIDTGTCTFKDRVSR